MVYYCIMMCTIYNLKKILLILFIDYILYSIIYLFMYNRFQKILLTTYKFVKTFRVWQTKKNHHYSNKPNWQPSFKFRPEPFFDYLNLSLFSDHYCDHVRICWARSDIFTLFLGYFCYYKCIKFVFRALVKQSLSVIVKT